MGVKVLSRKYRNQYRSNTEDVDWLLGNVGDWQQLELLVEAKIEFKGSTSETLEIDVENKTITLNNGKKWSDYGFDIGDFVTFRYVLIENATDPSPSVTTFQLSLLILNLFDDVMEHDSEFINLDYNIIPTDRGNVRVENVLLTTDKEPEGLKFQYGHMTNENSESNNLSSLIDGSITQFSFAGLQNLSPGVVGQMEADGLQSGMAIEKVTVEKSGNIIEVLNLTEQTNFRLETFKETVGGDLIDRQSMARTIPLSVELGNTDFQNAVSGLIEREWNTTEPDFLAHLPGDSNECFIYDTTLENIMSFQTNISFRISNSNGVDPNSYVRIVLYEYSNGAVLNTAVLFVQQVYTQPHQSVNQILNFSDNILVNPTPGSSFALGLQYVHETEMNNPRFIDVDVLSVSMVGIDPNEQNENNIYKIKCDYLMSGIFDSSLALDELTKPSYLVGDGSLTDNFKLLFYPEWNNPNVLIQNNLDYTQRLGNTGWFNENFNGLDNDFSIDSVQYKTPFGQFLNQLDHTQPVLVEADISGIANLSPNSKFIFGFSWIPQTPEDYKNKQTPIHENLFINTGKKYPSGSFSLDENTGTTIYEGNTPNNARIDMTAFENVMFTMVDSDTVKLKAVLSPTPEFTQFFESLNEDNRNYVLWISIADHDQVINFSNRVSLLLDYNNFLKVIPPAGELEGTTNKFLEHPEPKTEIGVDLYKGHVEDDILSKTLILIDPSEQFLNGLILGYEVANSNIRDANQNYVLEQYSVNTSNVPLVDGEQDINITESRGFLLSDGNNKNLVEIVRSPLNDTDNKKAYLVYFATKIRWEEWIAREDVPEEFYNTALENNGFHNDWLDYLRAGNYVINFYIKTNIFENQLLQYKNTFPIDFNGYDENLNLIKTHKYFRDSDDTEITIGTDPETGKPLGVFLANEPTRIEITFENVNENFNINQVYGVVSLEEYKGGGRFTSRQLSSVWDSEFDNPLIPVQGENKLKIESISSNIVKFVCLINPDNLQNANKFKITGRIGCYDFEPIEPVWILEDNNWNDNGIWIDTENWND